MSDPSGINVSDAGIGHKITIDIDKKTYLNDVSLYFSPDESDPTAGEISYPLNALDPGEHTLTLTVWDNANNSSSASISFKVAAAWLPSITALYTDANPASTNVNFFVKTDAADGITECRVEVFNLAGKLIWSGKALLYVGVTVHHRMESMRQQRRKGGTWHISLPGDYYHQ